MLLRTPCFILAAISSASCFAIQLPREFPTELVGTWVQPSKGEEGVMLVHVSAYTPVELTGVMVIRGSKDCPEPVAFSGVITADRVIITSTETVVCGYEGILIGEVRKDSSDTFSGTFAYKYKLLNLTFTWANGTFVLRIPLNQK